MFSLRSALRRKLLTYFYVNRSARVYVRQLAAALGVDSTNLSRELAALEEQGLFESEVEGRQRYYRLNPRYPYLKPLFTLLQGAVGLPSTLAAALKRVAGIERAYLVGSFAKGQADAASDIDLLLIGRPDPLELADSISRTGEERASRGELHCPLSAGAGDRPRRSRRLRERSLERRAGSTHPG